MKRILLIVGLLSLMPLSLSFAQSNTAIVIGARYDNVITGAYGLARNIGGPLWAVSTLDFGQEETYWHNELMALFKVPYGNKLYAGPVAGPAAEWINTTDEEVEVLTYLRGTVGVVANYELMPNFGIGGYAKYVVDLGEQAPKEKWLGAVAFTLKF